jgi:hypothetical protein
MRALFIRRSTVFAKPYMKSKQSLKMSNQKVCNEREYSILGVNKKYIQKVGYKISLN